MFCRIQILKQSYSYLLPSSLVFFLNFAQAAYSTESDVDVQLFKAYQPLKEIYLEAPLEISRPRKERLAKGIYRVSKVANAFKLESLTKSGPAIFISSHELILSPQSSKLRLGIRPEKLRAYKGKLRLVSGAGSGLGAGEISCHNIVSRIDYLNSVVGSETKIDFGIEALKAQSVLVQTAMLRYKRGDELNDSTEKQAYLGADYERAAVREAVRQTRGKSLRFSDRPVQVYFHACCAGATSSSALFTGKVPSMPSDRSVKCNYCRNSPFWQKTVRQIPLEKFQKKFPDGLPQIELRDESGRAIKVKYPSGKEESGYQCWLRIGQTFGWDKMPGTRYEISINTKNKKVELSSTGAGHGVGLCQSGAAGMAAEGADYEKILEFYFPGSKIFSAVNP